MIEDKISHYIESQFPAFYREDGPKFIAFVKSYYEWLEQPDNVIYKARHLLEWSDIDSTLDEFIIFFKEKYLKNIQFDTATNKQQLVKNSLDLYRSKGTERSVDLFFKLVFGTDAEVRYPGEHIFKLSDGIWEVPKYLEVTYNRFNIEYVGKQIVGSDSGATAFVEKYIRRRAGFGFVNMFYVSNIRGTFRKNEVLGISVNGRRTFGLNNTTRLVGSIESVILQDFGRDFMIGDVVSFLDSARGIGGYARVTDIGESSGVIDFILLESGWGYTLDADSIVSEKVLTANTLYGPVGNTLFQIHDTLIQPVITASFTQATGDLVIGDTILRMDGANTVASGIVLKNTQNIGNTQGNVTISVVTGPFALGNLTSNGKYINVTSISDNTTVAEVMGIPTRWELTVANSSHFTTGMHLHQSLDGLVYAQGTIDTITNNTLAMRLCKGSFSNGQTIVHSENSSANATVTQVDTTVGVYNIKKHTQILNFQLSNNDSIANSGFVFQYDVVANAVYSGLALHSSVSANAGAIHVVPLSGRLRDAAFIYTVGNSAVATVSTVEEVVIGGDIVESPYAVFRTRNTNAHMTVSTVSEGTGAQFDVGVIGDTEVIFIGTDIVNSNNVTRLDFDRSTLNIASNTGFAIGQVVTQTVRDATFNPSLVAANGLFTCTNEFSAGEYVQYRVLSGNSVPFNMEANNWYKVVQANSTTLKVSDASTPSSNVLLPNGVNETGHRFYQQAVGTVYDVGSGLVRIKDPYNQFAVSGGANSNLNVYGNTVNSAISSVVSVAALNTANSNYRYDLAMRGFSYGFPKSPQGNCRDILYDILTFGRFEIGSVESLAGVDPGSGYNVDAYVLIEEPAIAAFGRHNYFIEIANASSLFVTGEKVNQTQANLVYRDIQVDYGVFGNDYIGRTIGLNASQEVVSANDTIYYPYEVISFNRGDVDPFANTFIIETNLEVGDTVRYYTATGNTATLANNTVTTVTLANSSTIKVTGTVSFDYKAFLPSAIVNNFIYTTSSHTYVNGDVMKYVVTTGNTSVIELSNNSLYYLIDANSTGFRLSDTLAGPLKTLSVGAAETGHGMIRYNANNTGQYFVSYRNQMANNEMVLYNTTASNTAISGLANNTQYYVVNSSSIGFKLSLTAGGAPINLTAGSDETGHVMQTLSSWLPLDGVYSDNPTPGQATVHSVYTTGANTYVRIQGLTGNVEPGDLLSSNTNAYLTANVISANLYQVTSQAKAKVISANSTVLNLKRLQFENTFTAGVPINGEISGATANVVTIAEDYSTLQIGLNANLEANVITAEGQVTSLQVFDSGFGYTNSETVQFTSADGLRAGTAKIVIGGVGTGAGYYKSSKGFLSDSNALYDGDYYQEYSYEIFSKLSIDRYRDMFKQVMHVAGTKFFGSARVVEEDAVVMELSESAIQPTVFAIDIAPRHYWDFVNNTATFNHIEVGAITDTPGWTFTRNTIGTAMTAAGAYVEFAAGQPRITDRGFLMESARTNIFLNSLTGVTQSIAVDAVPYTLSFRGTGTITLSGASTAGPLVGTGATNTVKVTFTPTAGTLTCTVSGSCTNVNLEAGSFNTSWIPTNGVSVTRDADITSIPSSDVFYPLGLFAEIERVVDTTNSADVYIRLDSVVDDQAAITLNPSTDLARIQTSIGGVGQATISPPVTLALNTTYKIASSHATNSARGAVSGTLGTEDVTVTVSDTPTTIRFGSNFTGLNHPCGYLKRAAVFNSKLSNTHLQIITT